MSRSEKPFSFSLSVVECPLLINIPLTLVFLLVAWPCENMVWPHTHRVSVTCLCLPKYSTHASQGKHTSISLIPVPPACCSHTVEQSLECVCHTEATYLSSTGPTQTPCLQDYAAPSCRQIVFPNLSLPFSPSP